MILPLFGPFFMPHDPLSVDFNDDVDDDDLEFSLLLMIIMILIIINIF